jgi:hypothetical protein
VNQGRVPQLSGKRIRRLIFRAGLGDGEALVFGCYPTTHGLSFGPLIKGREAHLTTYSRDGVFDVHLTVREEGIARQIPIIHQPELLFWSDLADRFRGVGFNKPYDPKNEAYLLTTRGIRLLEQGLKGLASFSVEKDTATLDLDFEPLVALLEHVDLPSMFRLRPAQELFNYPELYRVGTTPEMECLRAKGRMLVTYPTDREVYVPLAEKLFGLDVLMKYLRSRGLEDSFIKSRRTIASD